MSNRVLLIIAFAVAALCLAVTVAFPGGRVARAQWDDNGYVDVGLILEAPAHTADSSAKVELEVIVVNHGSRTAYDVEVLVRVENPTLSHFSDLDLVGYREPPVGSVSLDSDQRTLRWLIPALGGVQREGFTAWVTNRDESSDAPVQFNHSLIPHEYFGEVTTSSFESELHKGNNTDRVWQYKISTAAQNNQYDQAGGNYTVDVSVDNAFPSPGNTVNFTITTDRATPPGHTNKPPPIDLKVDIELTDGLEVDDTGTKSYDPATKPDSVEYSDGVFNVGTLKTGDIKGGGYSVTLPIDVKDAAVVDEQCLTAKLTGNPPPGVGTIDDDVSDNVAKLCLGDQPPEPLASDQIAAFTIYPCVGNTDPPCDDTDDVRVRAVRTADENILIAGRAFVHIPEEASRTYDSHANSVNAGTVVSWQIPVTWDASEFDGVNTQWNNLRDGFVASGINGGDPPGQVHIRAFEGTTSELVYKMNSGTTPAWTGEDTVGYNPGASNGPYDEDYIAEFEKLGTYKLQFTAKLTRATLDGDEDCDPNSATPPVNQRFCATETYAFHVGPMAELGVRDGGASSKAGSDQVAFTVVGVNNRYEAAESGKVVVDLPAGTTGLITVPADTGTFDANANPPTWTWDIHDLEYSDLRRSKGLPGGETVTLIVDGVSANETATAKIAYDPYEVCIGTVGDSKSKTLDYDNQMGCEAHDEDNDNTGDGSWHEGTVFDLYDGNNTATITARAGTGGGGDDAPSPRAAKSGAPSVTVQWEAVATVNSVAVTHYQVERSASDWEIVADNVEETTWIDTTVEPGKTYRYRVRAVNGAGVAGPPSAPEEARVPDVPVVTREVEVIKEVEVDGGTETVFEEVIVEVEVEVPVLPAGPTGLTAVAEGEEAIALSWSGPDRLYDHPVRGYEVEASEDGELWTTLETQVDRASYTHRGLEAGSTRHYRVYAHNREGRSLASESVQATTGGVPPGPQSVAELFRPLIDYGLLTAVFHYDNGTQKWTFFDPAPEFAGLNTLAPIDLSAEPPVILIVHMRSIRVEFMGQTLYPGWNYITVR